MNSKHDAEPTPELELCTLRCKSLILVEALPFAIIKPHSEKWSRAMQGKQRQPSGLAQLPLRYIIYLVLNSNINLFIVQYAYIFF